MPPADARPRLVHREGGHAEKDLFAGATKVRITEIDELGRAGAEDDVALVEPFAGAQSAPQPAPLSGRGCPCARPRRWRRGRAGSGRRGSRSTSCARDLRATMRPRSDLPCRAERRAPRSGAKSSIPSPSNAAAAAGSSPSESPKTRTIASARRKASGVSTSIQRLSPTSQPKNAPALGERAHAVGQRTVARPGGHPLDEALRRRRGRPGGHPSTACWPFRRRAPERLSPTPTGGRSRPLIRLPRWTTSSGGADRCWPRWKSVGSTACMSSSTARTVRRAAIAPDVLRRLGARVEVLHADPDGRNINDRWDRPTPRTCSAPWSPRGPRGRPGLRR